MASTINASSTGSGGLITTGDASGQLALQANGVTQATVSSTGLAMATNQTISTANTYGFKNRIINGNMVIDQRNAGAVVTPANGAYTLDRYLCNQYPNAGKFSVQQTPSATETGYATRVGAGFTNYMAVTSLSAYSVSSGDIYAVIQPIEGYNIADLAWGTSNAKTVTLSFWVYSSLTGSFGGSLRNNGSTRSYPFSYTISSANTWTQISVTITGDTSGTWTTTNGVGIYVGFSLGAGSSYSGTANTWAGANYIQPTSSVSVVGTNAATWYVTGVQFEVGSQATSFDFRSITQELALCQRYCQTVSSSNSIVGQYLGGSFFFNGNSRATLNYYPPVTFRASPSTTYPSVTGGTVDAVGIAPYTFTSYNSQYAVPSFVSFYVAGVSSTPSVGQPAVLILASSQTIVFSAEL
jgi:hypothetical protein